VVRVKRGGARGSRAVLPVAKATVRAPAAAGARLLARCSRFAARGTRAAFVFSLKVAALLEALPEGSGWHFEYQSSW